MATAALLNVARSTDQSPGTPASRSKGWINAIHLGGMGRFATSTQTATADTQQALTILHNMEAWLGTRYGGVMDFQDKNSWTDVEDYDQRYIAIRAHMDDGYVPIISLPVLPVTTSTSVSGWDSDLRTWGAGWDPVNNVVRGTTAGYNAHWANLGTRLVNNGLAGRRLILRPGWEWNGNSVFSPFVNYRNLTVNGVTYPNNPTLVAGDRYGATVDWKNGWKAMVDTIRGVYRAAGKNPYSVEFAMTPNLGWSTWSQIHAWQCFPGRRWVDYVGADVYDTVVGGPYIQSGALVTGATMDAARQQVWNGKKNGPYGFDWLAAFARSRSLKVMIGETSVANQVDVNNSNPTGGQDNPTWFQNLNAWMWANADVMGVCTLYNIYVDREGDFRVWDPVARAPAAFPNTGTAYKALPWPTGFGGPVAAGAAMTNPVTPFG